MKIVFVTNCDSQLQKSFGAIKMMNSFSYFHPEIPIILYDENDTNRIMENYPGFCRLSYMGIIMKEVKEKYDAELVGHIDSDSLVLGRFNEILEDNKTEIFGVRNDGPHHDFADERNNRPEGIKNLENWKYLNCGLIITRSNDFLNSWIDLNKWIIDNCGSIKAIPLVEQGSYNLLNYSGKYKTRILDGRETNLFYGTSANRGRLGKTMPNSIKGEWGFNNWESWSDIIYKNEKFWLYDREVKCLHFAGGGSINAKKLQWDLFNPEVAKKLKEITKCNE